jgi:hypothetical protein
MSDKRYRLAMEAAMEDVAAAVAELDRRMLLANLLAERLGIALPFPTPSAESKGGAR